MWQGSGVFCSSALPCHSCCSEANSSFMSVGCWTSTGENTQRGKYIQWSQILCNWGCKNGDVKLFADDLLKYTHWRGEIMFWYWIPWTHTVSCKQSYHWLSVDHRMDIIYEKKIQTWGKSNISYLSINFVLITVCPGFKLLSYKRKHYNNTWRSWHLIGIYQFCDASTLTDKK